MDARQMVSFRIDKEITLREFETGDAEAVFEAVMKNYDHLKPFMHWITPDYSLASAQQFIGQYLKDREERRSLGVGIFRNDKFIGSIGFVNFDWLAMKTEIGYWISRDEEGKGIVSSACRLLIDFAFDELKMNRIEIRCSAENARSSAIPKRLGFIKEGLLRQSEYRDGRLHDFEVYGLLASEWKGKVSNL
jgi:ribosomal-protein-serine acetyltransferase